MKKLIVVPSVLSADFLNLERNLAQMEAAGIQWLHYDVMDYHFVPNLTFGPEILKQIKARFNFKIDAHLMVMTKRPLTEYLEPFFQAGVNQITLHVEAMSEQQLNEFMTLCHEKGVMASLALNPGTDVAVLEKWLPKLSNVLVMSVEPGFGGQAFQEIAVDKIKTLNALRLKQNLNLQIEIDGGINDKTIHKLDHTGIDMVVAGSYLFGHADLAERIEVINHVE
jgi:ribulose-phosphate 3-epimerase